MKSKMSVRKRKPSRRFSAKGREIIASLTEVADVLEAGQSDVEHFTARTVAAPKEPGIYDAPRIRATREKLGASQSVFAGLLGVSTVLVQSWERGVRTAAPWARRLLDEVNRDPSHWREMLRSPAA
jgi:DNA-binding transcriptional regulator YiaG